MPKSALTVTVEELSEKVIKLERLLDELSKSNARAHQSYDEYLMHEKKKYIDAKKRLKSE